MSRGRSRFLGRNFHQRLKFIFNIFILSLFGFFHDCTAVKEKNLVSAYLPIGEIIGRNVERVSAFYGYQNVQLLIIILHLLFSEFDMQRLL